MSQAGFQDDVIKLDLDGAETVADFLKRREPLSPEQCLSIVNEAIRVLRDLYVHLPVKRSMYAVEPVRRLELLRLRLQRYIDIARQSGPAAAGVPHDDMWFHREMADALTSLRDRHTMYVLPEPFDRAVALVPFQIESYLEGNERRYLVASVIDGLRWFEAPESFKRGVEVTHWNDIPIPRAVELIGARNPGSNPEARLAHGIARLTIRPLTKAPPPDEECVRVRYTTEEGKPGTASARWHVVMLDAEQLALMDGIESKTLAQGLDYETDIIRTVTRRTWARDYRRSDRLGSLRDLHEAPTYNRKIEHVKAIKPDGTIGDIVQARTFRIPDEASTLPKDRDDTASTDRVRGPKYGYIRLRSFKVDDPDAFVKAFIDILERMPRAGLILDIRDNPGGIIQAGEMLLQLFTPGRIRPEPAQLVNSPLSLLVCETIEGMLPWCDSIRRALQTNSTYSALFPLTTESDCNRWGQRYYGPVILVTNAMSYSTADIFAAGFQDHAIGAVLGVDGSTGAGGANVIKHSWLSRQLKGKDAMPDRPSALPAGDLRFAIRRTLRVGRRAGTELEDLGVIPDIQCKMTKDDILHDNVDLILAAVANLRALPKHLQDLQRIPCDLRIMESSLRRTGDELRGKVVTHNIDRLDLSIGTLPGRSQPVSDGENEIWVSMPSRGGRDVLQLRGYSSDDRLIAARKLRLSPELANAA